MTRRVLLVAVASLVWASASSAEASEPHAPTKPTPPAATAVKPQAAKAAAAHVAETAEPVAPAAKSPTRGKVARTATGETLEEIVARVKQRIAEQQAASSRRAPGPVARARVEQDSAVHLEWRPGVTWPSELVPATAAASSAAEGNGRVTIDWGASAPADPGRVSVDWGMAP